MVNFPWSLFAVLLALSLLGYLALLPYARALTDTGAIKTPRPRPDLSDAVLFTLRFLLNLVLYTLATGLGLLAAGKTGLRAPLLEAALNGQPAALPSGALLAVLLLALVSAGLTLVLDRFGFLPHLPRALAGSEAKIALWKRLLASFYGAINEEILIRLFVMGGLAWLLGLVWKSPSGLPAVGAFWAASLLSALIFGIGHLPATSSLAPLTPAVVARALLLNGIPGLAFGWLFWRFGLEAAMLAHFFLDLVIHGLGPRIKGLNTSAAGKSQAPVP